MIPGWQDAIVAGLDALRPGGQLSIVDFGDQSGLPSWFRQGLRRWLAAFHVTPLDLMADWLAAECQRRQASLDVQTWFGGYATYASVTVQAVALARPAAALAMAPFPGQIFRP